MATSVPPSGNSPPPPQSAPAQASTGGQAVELPRSAASILQSGRVLSGQVGQQPTSGQLAVQTAEGRIVVQTPTALPQGTNVSLNLVSSGPPPVLSVQPQPAGATATAPGGTGAAAARTAPQTVVTSLTQGAIFKATVVTSGQTTATAQATAPHPGQQGTPTTNAPASAPNTAATAQRATGAPQQAAGRISGASPGQTAGQGQQTATSTQTAPQAGAVRLPSGHTVPLRVLGFQLPGATATPALAASATGGTGTVLSGQVTMSQPGQTLVQTPGGTLSLPTGSSLPVGTALSLEVLGKPQPISGLNALSQMTTMRWQALADALSSLQAGDPTAAQRLTQMIPQNTPQLSSAVLFLFSALRIGSADKWLGRDMLRSMEAAQKGSSEKLGKSFQAAQTRTTDSSGQPWRVFHLPVLNETLQELRLYLHDQTDDEEKKQGGQKQDDKRFIVEANFSRFGPLQFDGLNREKNLNLMIRSHAPLPQAVRDGIRALFRDTVSALGFSGYVDFQVTPKFTVSANATQGKSTGGITI